MEQALRHIQSRERARQYLVTSFLNLDEQPKPIHDQQEYTVAYAWLSTGQYIRKAFITYGQEVQKTIQDNPDIPAATSGTGSDT